MSKKTVKIEPKRRSRRLAAHERPLLRHEIISLESDGNSSSSMPSAESTATVIASLSMSTAKGKRPMRRARLEYNSPPKKKRRQQVDGSMSSSDTEEVELTDSNTTDTDAEDNVPDRTSPPRTSSSGQEREGATATPEPNGALLNAINSSGLESAQSHTPVAAAAVPDAGANAPDAAIPAPLEGGAEAVPPPVVSHPIAKDAHGKPYRRRVLWTADEEDYITTMINRHGGRWAFIAKAGVAAGRLFGGRTGHDVADKWRILRKRGDEIPDEALEDAAKHRRPMVKWPDEDVDFLRKLREKHGNRFVLMLDEGQKKGFFRGRDARQLKEKVRNMEKKETGPRAQRRAVEAARARERDADEEETKEGENGVSNEVNQHERVVPIAPVVAAVPVAAPVVAPAAAPVAVPVAVRVAVPVAARVVAPVAATLVAPAAAPVVAPVAPPVVVPVAVPVVAPVAPPVVVPVAVPVVAPVAVPIAVPVTTPVRAPVAAHAASPLEEEEKEAAEPPVVIKAPTSRGGTTAPIKPTATLDFMDTDDGPQTQAFADESLPVMFEDKRRHSFPPVSQAMQAQQLTTPPPRHPARSAEASRQESLTKVAKSKGKSKATPPKVKVEKIKVIVNVIQVDQEEQIEPTTFLIGPDKTFARVNAYIRRNFLPHRPADDPLEVHFGDSIVPPHDVVLDWLQDGNVVDFFLGIGNDDEELTTM
ncbi:Aste57867_25281 [Aphanomyces stellatus]|uniref:Aste57867_25281 protein n=1 Tax=Aphanomyces stellatus TaxID=120398 RepID=A0A485LU21_9STRA|nr:hypothetical protein As57867_025203 [Aphanomyces stellatus]VFU01907.1 Aste57867_25281 [Aphanomyces stellatus]